MAWRSQITDLQSKAVIILLLVVFAVMTVRLFSLQVVSHDYYEEISEENSFRMVPISAPRGYIRDRNGELLVTNRALYTISYLPYLGQGRFENVEYLAKLIGIEEDALRKKFENSGGSRYDPIKLVRDVEFEVICRIEENYEKLPGIIYQTEITRQYPENNYGSHLFGYVGEISDEDLKKRDPNIYKQGDIIGVAGIEKQYDRILRGRDGVDYLEVSASGKILRKSPFRPQIPPQIGSELILNIDWKAQTVAESLLSNYLGGAVVAVDPADGGVLVFTSQPNYDINAFAGVVSKELWSAVSTDSTHPLLNRACVGTYPPGSIFKVVTAGAALEVDSVSVEDMFRPCYGAMRFGNRTFKCWKPSGHGRQNMLGAIVHSCDVYFYQLGKLIGLDVWARYSEGSGFGKPFNLDYPNESPGISPSTAYLDRKYGENRWSRLLILNMSIGQGELLVTPLQMASFYAAIANGGILHKPQLADKIISPDGEIFEMRQEEMLQLPFSASTISFFVKSLTAVVQDSQGTGRPARIPGITVAGKTGTAQNPHGLEHSWFACFAPVENPQIAVAVIAENAGHGSTHAAPIAREVIKAYLRYEEPIEPLTEEENEISAIN
ncbi:MAG: penicillin-binding protein 2 [candidate division Zixibacteria bacterium]|nr:penicillin-binding protein 2 [candidate division Zixibacteria bacterium]